MLLTHGANANIPLRNGWACLFEATTTDQLEIIRTLIKHGANVDVQTRRGWTPLLVAIDSTKFEAAKLLLALGADPNIANEIGVTPLFEAVVANPVDMVRIFLDNGARLDPQIDSRWTPLDKAVDGGQIEILTLLFNATTQLLEVAEADCTQLFAAAHENKSEVVRRLTTRLEKVILGGLAGWIALCLAARAGHTGIIKILTENGAGRTYTAGSGWTSLHLAAREGHADAVEVMLQQGADSGCISTGAHESAAIHCAIMNDHHDVVKTFIKHKINKDIPNACGQTPLHLACRGESQSILGTILEAGTLEQINATDFLGRTPIIYAICESLQASVFTPRLLHLGAAVGQADFKGFVVLHHCILKILDSLRAKKAQKKSAGLYPVPETICGTDQLLLSSLLFHGADPLHRDNYGWSSLDWAALDPDLLGSEPLAAFRYAPNDEEQAQRDRREALAPAIHHLVLLTNLKQATSREVLSQCYDHVGRLLLFNGHSQDARTVLMLSIFYDNGNDTKHDALCDICDLRIKNDRHLCMSCAEIDFCDECMQLYKREAKHRPPDQPLLGRCKGHETFLISGQAWQELPNGKVSAEGESLKEFVEHLRITYT